MDRCRNINCLKALGRTAYHCCNPHDRFCQYCSRLYRCRQCNNFPTNRVVLSKCQSCNATSNLLACQCAIICHPCTFKSPRCLKCNKFFEPISSLNPGPKKTLNQTGNIISQSPVINNYVQPNNFVPTNEKPFNQILKQTPKKQPQRDFCSKCYNSSNLDQLFCNINCLHLLCKKCMSSNPRFCPSTGCASEIDKQSIKSFLKLCLDCETPLTGSFQDLGMCANCISKAQQAQKMFVRDTTQAPDLDFQKKQSLDNQNNRQEEITHQFQDMTITVNRPSQPLEKSVASKPILDSNLSPRGNYLQQLPSVNKNLLHPNRVNDDAASSLGKSVARSRASSNLSEIKKKGRCIFCNIEVDAEFLFSFKECKKSSNKKHRGCMCCLMKNRSSRSCAGCLQDQQEELKKKLTYIELTDTQRLRLNEDMKKTKGLQFCGNCQVPFPSGKLMKVEGKAICRRCSIK